jgi:hypothetical protein
MHLRPPSIDQGVQAGLAAAAIFFYVRLFGEEKPRRQRIERD